MLLLNMSYILGVTCFYLPVERELESRRSGRFCDCGNRR